LVRAHYLKEMHIPLPKSYTYPILSKLIYKYDFGKDSTTVIGFARFNVLIMNLVVLVLVVLVVVVLMLGIWRENCLNA